LNIILEDQNVDAAIIILTPQANTEIKKTAKTIVKADRNTDKPIMASFMGEEDVQKGINVLEENHVPDFQDPVDEVKTLKAMNQYQKFLETEKTYRQIEYDEQKAEDALKNYNSYMDGHQLLEAYGFQMPLTKLAKQPESAQKAGSKVGYSRTQNRLTTNNTQNRHRSSPNQHTKQKTTQEKLQKHNRQHQQRKTRCTNQRNNNTRTTQRTRSRTRNEKRPTIRTNDTNRTRRNLHRSPT